MTYQEKAKDKRFVIFVGESVHCETRDREHMEHVKRILKSDGCRDVSVEVRDGNQDTVNKRESHKTNFKYDTRKLRS